MHRRRFIAASTAIAAIPPAFAGTKEPLPKSVFYRIVMVDPRLITKTDDTHAVGYSKSRSDVMGSVYLSHAESLKLHGLLSTALTSSTDVPFCGHSPAYVIVRMNGARAVNYVSVCALCGTWCGADGDLKVLDDAKLMPFLTKALPLPSAFSKVQQLADLYDLDKKLSFLELPSQP